MFQPASRIKIKRGEQSKANNSCLWQDWPQFEALIMSETIFIGTDCGATTTKFAAVRENGEPVTIRILQRPTDSQNVREAVIAAWIAGVGEFLAQNHLQWSQVQGVGLAIPGPYERYGVLGKSANFPAGFAGWNVHQEYSAALARQAGHPVKLTVNNDGHCGGVAEARIA